MIPLDPLESDQDQDHDPDQGTRAAWRDFDGRPQPRPDLEPLPGLGTDDFDLDAVPMTVRWFRHVPDLERIRREEWVEVLSWFPDVSHFDVLLQAPGDRWENLQLLDLIDARKERIPPQQRILRDAVRLPVPEATGRRRASRGRVLGVRLTDREERLLARAAERVGLKPSQLARALLLNGSAALVPDDETR